MTPEEAFQEIDSELSVTHEMRLSGAMEEVTGLSREEDLRLGRVLIEQGREDADIVMTALDLQHQSVEDGVTPMPRLLRIIREVKAPESIRPSDSKPPQAPVDPPAEPLRDFRAEMPDTSVKSRPEYPVPMEPPKREPPSSRLLARPSTRSRRAPEPPPPPVRKSRAGWIGLGLLIVAGAMAGGAVILTRTGGGPGGGAGLAEVRKLVARAEQDRVDRRGESDAHFLEAIEVLNGLLLKTASAEGFELRGQARWRLASVRGRYEPEALADLEQALKIEPGRATAQALRGLVRVSSLVRSNGGWEPVPARLLQATLTKAYPGHQAQLGMAETLPPRFGKFAEGMLDDAKTDLRAGADARNAGPIAALAGRVLKYLENSPAGMDPSLESEEIAWAVAAAVLPSADGRRLILDGLAKLPDNPLLLGMKGALFASEGRFEDALDASRAVLLKDETNGPALLVRAAVHIGRGQVKPALEDLEKAATKGDTSPLLKCLKAAALLLGGQAGSSMAEIDGILEEHPILLFRLERTAALLLGGQKERVREELRGLASPVPKSPRLGLFVAQCYWHLADVDATLDELNRISGLTLDADLTFELLEFGALVLLAKGEEKQAYDAYRKASQIRRPADFLGRWEAIARSNYDWQVLKDMATEGTTKTPNSAHFWALMAEASLRLDQWEDVVRAATKTLEFNGEARAALMQRWTAYEKLERYQEAHDDLTQVLARQSDALWVYGLRAYFKARMGQWKAAKEEADKAIYEKVSDRPLALAWLTLSLVAAQDAIDEPEYAEAKREKAIQLLAKAGSGGDLKAKDVPRDGPFAPLKDLPGFKDAMAGIQDAWEKGQAQLKEQAFLGITMATLQDGRTFITGTLKGTPARKAALIPQDVVLEVNGQPVKSMNDLMDRLRKFTPGTTITLKIERGFRPANRLTFLREIVLGSRKLAPDNE